MSLVLENALQASDIDAKLHRHGRAGYGDLLSVLHRFLGFLTERRRKISVMDQKDVALAAFFGNLTQSCAHVLGFLA